MKISLNNLNYRQDVHKVFNIFYPMQVLEFNQEDFDFSIEVTLTDVIVKSITEEITYKIGPNIKLSVSQAVFSLLSAITGINHPWGVLVGIRPSKIALQLIQQGFNRDYIIDYYANNYFITRDKANLCFDVAQFEQSIINKDKNIVSIYIGMPFCPTRCTYCSFASNPINSNATLVEPYLKALSFEIISISKYIKEKNLNIQTVYFGGGTPTSISDGQFSDIIKTIYENFINGGSVKEFTVECGRPDSISTEKLQTMKQYNVDRISINPQTMNNNTLKKVGRAHSVDDVINKFNMARAMGFKNINMDIIVGLPGEGLKEIQNTCEAIYNLSPDSVTVHGMTIKRASKIHEDLVNQGADNTLKLETIYEMYEQTKSLAESLEMKAYYMYRQRNMIGNMENIGYAKEKKESIYNIQMIEEKQTIIAFGADAITKIVFLEENRIERFGNIKDVSLYISRINELIDKKIHLLNTLY